MEIPFSFHVKMGEQMIEIDRTRGEVIETIGELPNLVASISKAFELAKNRVATSETVPSRHPSVPSSSCSEAILQLLGTDWGASATTSTELEEALGANALHYPCAAHAQAHGKNKVKRSRNGKGYVHILAGGKT